MSERPILFSSEMVCALLGGRKTETRRLTRNKRGKPTVWARLADAWEAGDRQHRLWVREAFRRTDSGIIYRADVSAGEDSDSAAVRWHPSIHMPRELSRLTLTITNVARQSLHDISEAEARNEGAVSGVVGFPKCGNGYMARRAGETTPM